MGDKIKVYFSTLDFNLASSWNAFADEGFDIEKDHLSPTGAFMLSKTFRVDKDNWFVKKLIDNYNDKENQKIFYKGNIKDYLSSINLNFYKKDGRLILDVDDKALDTLTKLKLCIYPTEDGIVDVRAFDQTCPFSVTAAKFIYDFAPEEIKNLEEKGLITHKFLEKNA